MFYCWIDIQSQEFEQPQEVAVLIVLISLSAFALISMMIILINYLQKKKINFVLEQERNAANYEEQLLKAQIETTEQNMRNISMELHDNVGQLLSVGYIKTKILSQQDKEITKNDITEVSELISESLTQIRGLSKGLNTDIIRSLGLKQSISNELERIKRMELLNTNLNYDENIDIPIEKEIIIFRIIQESISNTIKHAKATELTLEATKTDNLITISLSDNGKGYDVKTISRNNGTLNMNRRATLIDAIFEHYSEPGKGTYIKLILTI